MSNPSTSTGVHGNGAPPSNEPPTLRSKVIEILASTANGCLTELGYYPGMPQRLQELERQNAQWQQENVKLFRDNQALTHALHELRKGSQQEKTIQALQTQVQRLIQEKSILTKQNQTLLAGQPTAYKNLLMEYTQFQEHYQRAVHEIRTLRHHNAVLSGRTPVQSPVTPGPAVFNPPVFGPQGAPPVQKPPSSTGSFSIPQDPVVDAKQPLIPVPSQQPRQIVIGDQNHARKQTPTMPNTQQAHSLAFQTSVHHHQDLNLPSSISRVSRSQPSSRPVSSTNSSRPALSLPLPVSTTATALVHTRNAKSEDMAGCLPAPMSAPPIPHRHPFHSVPKVESPSLQQARPPVPNSVISSRKYSLPLTLSHPIEPSGFIPTPSALLRASPTDTPTTRSIDGTTQKNTVNEPPLNAHVNSNEEQKPFPVNHSHESASPATPFEAVTPMNVTINDPPTVTVVSTPPIESLKRPSLVMPNMEGLPILKKPRLDGQEDLSSCVEPERQENLSGSVEPTGLEGQENVCSSVESKGPEGQEKAGSSEEPTTDTVKTPVSSLTNEDTEESEDEDVRVGPDGLRLVEDCLPALIEDEEENPELKACKLCTARFRLGYTTIEPKPFINATIEELVQHCSSEHQSAWERLRNTV